MCYFYIVKYVNFFYLKIEKNPFGDWAPPRPGKRNGSMNPHHSHQLPPPPRYKILRTPLAPFTIRSDGVRFL